MAYNFNLIIYDSERVINNVYINEYYTINDDGKVDENDFCEDLLISNDSTKSTIGFNFARSIKINLPKFVEKLENNEDCLLYFDVNVYIKIKESNMYIYIYNGLSSHSTIILDSNVYRNILLNELKKSIYYINRPNALDLSSAPEVFKATAFEMLGGMFNYTV